MKDNYIIGRETDHRIIAIGIIKTGNKYLEPLYYIKTKLTILNFDRYDDPSKLSGISNYDMFSFFKDKYSEDIINHVIFELKSRGLIETCYFKTNKPDLRFINSDVDKSAIGILKVTNKGYEYLDNVELSWAEITLRNKVARSNILIGIFIGIATNIISTLVLVFFLLK